MIIFDNFDIANIYRF